MYFDEKNQTDVKLLIFEQISNVTGHKLEDLDLEMFLESDLGIDSIKMVTLMNELMKLVSAEDLENFTSKYPITYLMSLQTIGEIVLMFEEFYNVEESNEEIYEEKELDNNCEEINRIDIKAMVYELISNVTGHKVVDLDLDMFLESDLGIDSIKMVTLMTELMKLIPKEEQDNFNNKYPINYLISLQTIGEIVLMFQEFYNTETLPKDGVEEKIEAEELMILNAQYPFLVSYWSVGTLTICSGVKLEGQLNLDLLQESWLELIKRNPSLASEFEAREGSKSFKDYKLKIYNKPLLPEINVQDIRNLPEEAKNKAVKQIIEDMINTPFDIFKFPLHKIMVIQTSYMQYELIFANNHLVSDGLSNQQILREILEIYSGKMQGVNINLPKKLTIEEYNNAVSEINNWNSAEENKNLEKYVQANGKAKHKFNPFNNTKFKNDFALVKVQKYWLNEILTKQLLEKSRIWRVSLFTLIVSAYLKTIRELEKENEEIIINLPTGGKVYPNFDATGIIGCFAQNMALNFRQKSPDENLMDFVTEVDKEIKENISGGIDRAQIYRAAKIAKEQEMLEDGKMSKTTASIIRSSLKSNLYLSFVGDTKLKETYGDLNVIDYEAYTSTNAGAIDNLVELFNNKIIITSNYDSLHFNEDNIKTLIEAFISNLELFATYQIDIKYDEIKLKTIEDNRLIEELTQIAEEVCVTAINRDDINRDLVTDFGVDSLQIIRIITRLAKIHKGIDRNSLFKCRTLSEMALVIENNNSKNENELIIEVNSQYADEISYMKIVKQCKETPNLTAILYKDENITYRELDRMSNKIANYLRSQGIKRGSLVGIMVYPGPMMLIGMLGIMKAGAAYVPVDPVYPADRIQYIMKSAGIEILLTEHGLKEFLSRLIEKDSAVKTLMYLDHGVPMNFVDDYNQVLKEHWMEVSGVAPEYINSPDDLMTVLYTSGSTGNPKGVMLGHSGYMNRLKWHQDTFKLKLGERVAQKTSCCFDISVWELFWPLMYGGTVCPARNDIVKNPWALAEWLIDAKINVMHFVPSLFGEFVNSLEDDDYSFKDLRWLIFSGEALPMPIIQKWIDKYGLNIGLANLYGPTEASIDVTCHIIEKRPGAEGENTIPIGKPISNVFIKNLDENMKELPEGEIGELWIGGIQLAKGYKNNKEKTEESFKPNPFKEIPGDYLYKTGDLTTKKPDGSYEYLGRIDNQVKIRGFRVELGEIEAVLGAHPNVNEVAVIAVDYIEGQKQLIAWMAGNRTDDSKLKEFILRKLPYYMVPHHFEWIAALPKTPNGKLDRKVLKEKSKMSLNGEKVEIFDTSQFNVKDSIVEEIPLAPAQKFLMSYFDYPYQWTGYTRFLYKQPLDCDMFNKALTIAANNNDALRSILVNKDGKWMQKFVSDDQIVEADYYDGSHLSEEERNEEIKNLINEIIRNLEVDKWPLWKVAVIRVNDSTYAISVVGHHLISDLITNQLLFKEIWRIYSQLISGNCNIKIEDRRSYRDFVLEVNKEKNKRSAEFIEYYKKQFPSESYSLKINEDLNLGNNDEGSAELLTLTLDKAETLKLQTTGKKCFGTSFYSIILAPLYRMLQKKYGKSWVVVSHRMNGRMFDNSTFFNTVGNFAINYPLGIFVDNNDDWREIVNKITDGVNKVPLNGISYDLVSEELPSYMYPDLKLTSIRANYLGNRNNNEYGVFEFSKDNMDRRYSHPEQKRISSIEIFFSIVDGKLILEIEYSKNKYEEATIRNLGNEYIKAATEMLSYINNKENLVVSSGLKPLFTVKENKRQGVLTDKVVIVTGGGRGIGRTMAVEAAKEDAKVVIISRTEWELKETEQEIKKIGGGVISIVADISNYGEVSEAVNKIVSTYGKIDVLINNAGITKLEAFSDMNVDEWKNIIEVNLFGTYNMCKAVAPHLVSQRSGKIINMGSDSSFIGYPLMSAYAASKHAVIGLTKSLSEELKLSNIQVNAICPAFVDTNMTPEALRKNAIPTEKVADLAVFLASDKSDYITGEAIKIFGNQDMYWFGAHQIPIIKAAIKAQSNK
ncbi:non-ribosomal peptide synthetase [Clostridium beijerinckii]|uniref:non-ribosomal peptide synthetase n=1 Tax=Clostridium beijerinckii TaxID=1520 RepID=UPI00098CBB46|nr:non-ribosomal peptide synthetase [Clostridium beijerinckii]NOW04514.1 amino acid adenylation domain-containing protein/non-ribosomal peptide synthase protein (TIGR01720 family) [Clostridium beijerinckii]NRU38832.1 amino acid adenylation domain-containing protein/non-ribosomal peptide synthase protein (TIGR01720 family) [Clostridium beijerinckii]NSA97889.1 amino acid adenylation domain-containing protein/non-ribosomal peptide synthase protein (TIGR01720 family) [Clostridium beijerinckii]NYC02